MRMFYKKGFPVLLAATLMATGGAFPVFAEMPKLVKAAVSEKAGQGVENVKISREKALEIAKKAIPIPEGFVQRNIEFQSNWWNSQSPAWILFWDKQVPPSFGNIQVVVDGNTGSILNIEMYHNPNQKSTYPPKVDLGQAKEIALEYLKNHFPQQSQSLVYDSRVANTIKPPLNGFIEYPIIFKQEVNGIPFDGNEIRVTVNGEGTIVNLSYRWTEGLEFPPAEEILSMEQVQKVYKDKMNLSLKMLPQWGPSPEPKMNMGYVPQGLSYYEGSIIRAVDGKFLTPWGDVILPEETELIPISDKKLGELNNGKITQEKALEILRKHFHVPQDNENIRVSFRENNGRQAVWEFNWEIKQGGVVTGWSMASVDAKTGRILNYNNEKHVYMEKESSSAEKPQITKEEAEKQAIELMKTLHPDLAHQLYLQKMPKNPEMEANPRFYSVPFIRQVNGVSLEYGGISVNFDFNRGEITNYWFDAQNLSIPETKPEAVSQEVAAQTYMDHMDFKLMYMLPQPRPVVKAGETSVPKKANLVYQARLKAFNAPVYLDALTGKWINRETGEPVIESGTVNDIKGHSAEKELQLLVKYNVFDVKDQRIFPNEEITRGEMIKMLILLENNGYQVWYDVNRPATFKDVAKTSPYYAYVENAVERRLIDPGKDHFNPDDKINREELAGLIVKALGYEILAKTKDLFNNNLKDSADIQVLGSAILVSRLGIMDTTDGKFLPGGKVTRADAAVAFYRYLSKRNELMRY